ncbi:MAG: hypothetical protein HGA90_03610, partial [Alphaproteobacteria bacterium]|nr:hypothetical protein [Alphaproteobacteria bacterium]
MIRASSVSRGSAAACSNSRAFFAPSEIRGRKIVGGFSYLQRVGKAAATDLWFPSDLQEEVAARLAAGDASVLDAFQVEWAAVRQFELLREAGNLAIEDLEVANFKRAFQNLMKMRAGGYRVTVVTLGRYASPGKGDDLRLLDQKLQEEITRLIHMLYLEDQSAVLSAAQADQLRREAWRYAEALPHVERTLVVESLLGKRTGRDASPLRERFFHLLEGLPQRHIAHDVAVGLTLPEAAAERNWIYLAKAEHRFSAFQTALANVFRAADCLSLGALQERAGAASR